MSLTHPYQCTRCKERFHKIHEATAHYLCSHQNSNDLPKKEIPENDTKIKIEKFDDPIKTDIKIEIKKEIKCETDVQRGLQILEKFELPIENKISKENNESQKAKSENEDLQSEIKTDLSDITSEKYQKIVVQKEAPVGENEFECKNGLEMSTTEKTKTSTMLVKNPHSVFRACIFRSNVYCDLCQLKINFDDLNQHLNGKRHVRSLKIGIPKFSCELCNFEIKDQNKLFKHLSGEEHKKKANAEKEKIEFRDNELPKGQLISE